MDAPNKYLLNFWEVMTSGCGDPKDKVEKMPKMSIALSHDKDWSKMIIVLRHYAMHY